MVQVPIVAARYVKQLPPAPLYVLRQPPDVVSKTYPAVEQTQSVISSLPVSVNVVEIVATDPGQAVGAVSEVL
jgi:hypothetical protein